MAFEVLAIDDGRWSELVRYAEGDIFYEPSYCRFLTEGTPHLPIMLLYEDDLGKVFDVTLVKAISSLPFFADIADQFTHPPVDLASPDYNSPIVRADPRDSAELLQHYRRPVDQYCRETGVVTEFVRFHPLSESAELVDIYPGAELLYIDLRPGYQNALHGYRKGHKSTIKKAAREGAEFRFCTSNDTHPLAKVYELYIEAMQRKDAKSVYLHKFAHFQNMARHLGDRLLIMQSWVGDQVASANIFLLDRKHIWFKLFGTGSATSCKRSTHIYVGPRNSLGMRAGVRSLHFGRRDRTGRLNSCLQAGLLPSFSQHSPQKRIHNEKAMNLLVDAKRAYDSRLGLPTRTAYFPSYWLS
jgi:hypothetical protein